MNAERLMDSLDEKKSFRCANAVFAYVDAKSMVSLRMRGNYIDGEFADAWKLHQR